MNALLAGFGLGLSLIVAIGAQNAFVLRQGVRRQHVFWVCLVCAASDALLIIAGVFGFSTAAKLVPSLEPVMRYVGSAFLFCYGLKSFWQAYSSNNSLQAAEDKPQTLKMVILTCLVFTWCNPHVYLDTVVLLGSIASGFAGQRVYFAIGAALASFSFFFSLGYGATLLRPLFVKPMAWKVLDVLTGIVMWVIAIKLL